MNTVRPVRVLMASCDSGQLAGDSGTTFRCFAHRDVWLSCQGRNNAIIGFHRHSRLMSGRRSRCLIIPDGDMKVLRRSVHISFDVGVNNERWSGIALSRLLLPVHGTVYHRLSRYRRHCRLLSAIWRRRPTCSQHPTSDAHSSSPSFLFAEHVEF